MWTWKEGGSITAGNRNSKIALVLEQEPQGLLESSVLCPDAVTNRSAGSLGTGHTVLDCEPDIFVRSTKTIECVRNGLGQGGASL